MSLDIEEGSSVQANDASVCVICLENYSEDTGTMNFNCGHILHIDCTHEWVCTQFKRNVDITCPVCRFVQCHVKSPYYRRLKHDLGICTTPTVVMEEQHPTSHFEDNQEQSRQHQRQRVLIEYQRDINVLMYRVAGMLTCLFMLLLLVFVVLIMKSRRDK